LAKLARVIPHNGGIDLEQLGEITGGHTLLEAFGDDGATCIGEMATFGLEQAADLIEASGKAQRFFGMAPKRGFVEHGLAPVFINLYGDESPGFEGFRALSGGGGHARAS
jgi:hypothetical protein